MDKLCALLKDVEYSLLVYALNHGLMFKSTASGFRQEMLSWLEKENPKPSWHVLSSALTGMGRHGEAAHIEGIGVHA